MSHRTRTTVVSLAALALLAAGCRKGAPAAADSLAGGASGASLLNVENVVVAASGSVESGPTISGSLVAENEADMRAQIASTVLATMADVGQRVARGQVLARLDDRGLRDAVLSARAALRSAETTAGNAQRELSRQERLVAIEAVAQADVDAARGTAINAQATLADARSRLTSAEQQLGYATVRAPIGGTVAARAVSTGDAVQMGAALFTVVDPTNLRLEASVPAEALAGVTVGTPVQFSVRGYPGRAFAGKITRVSPAADPATRQVQVFASIPNTGAGLVTGLFASGRVATRTATGIVVPVAAIDGRNVTPSVARVARGVVQHVNVTLGLRDEATQRVQVTSGVALGDTLLVGGAQQLPAGTRVTITRGDGGTQLEARR